LSVHEIINRGARVLIRNGEVFVLTEPMVSYCPFVAAVYGFKHIDKTAVKRAVEMRIEKFGLFTDRRAFPENLVVPYGTSEIIKTCMEAGLLDCAVTVCDGAGTVISWSPSLVQGIGAYLTGIVSTSPIENTIRYIERHGGAVLDAETARIDQVEGFRRAVELGYRRVAVTVAGFRACQILRIRALARRLGVEAAIFSVCNTCVKAGEVDCLRDADVVCAGASRLVKSRIGPLARMQLGVGIPVFMLTKLAKDLALEYIRSSEIGYVAFRCKMPYLVEERSPKLRE